MSVTVTIETPELTLSKTRRPSGSSHQTAGDCDFSSTIHTASVIASLVEALDASKVYKYSVREHLLKALNRQVGET